MTAATAHDATAEPTVSPLMAASMAAAARAAEGTPDDPEPPRVSKPAPTFDQLDLAVSRVQEAATAGPAASKVSTKLLLYAAEYAGQDPADYFARAAEASLFLRVVLGELQRVMSDDAHRARQATPAG